MAIQRLTSNARTKLLSADVFYQSNFHRGFMQFKLIKTQFTMPILSLNQTKTLRIPV